MDSEQSNWSFFVYTYSINETDTIPTIPDEGINGASDMDTNKIVSCYNFHSLHYILFVVVLCAIAIAIRIYLRVLCCRAMANIDASIDGRSSRVQVYTLTNSGNGQAAPIQNQVHVKVAIIPTQETKQDTAKDLNATLEKYLRAREFDEHIIDVDQRQALL